VCAEPPGPDGIKALCVAVVLGRIGMDMDMGMVMDVDVDTGMMAREVLEATATDARLSDSVPHAADACHDARARRCVATSLLDSGEVTVKAQDCDGKTTLMVVAGRGRLECNDVAGDDGGRVSAHGWACGVGEGVQDTAAAMVDATTDAWGSRSR
jgi:hypothetical protein